MAEDFPNQLPSFLGDKKLKLIFFGGKGGVGKTTCAAAAALQTSKHGRKTLIMSINPAHSLSASFECEVGKKITKVNSNLYALEIDSEELFQDYKKKYWSKIMTIIDRGTFLELEDLSSLLDRTLPGMDEVMAMFKLVDLIRAKEYDLIIIDTAATGHMTRFLTLPKHMSDFNKILSIMQAKYRYIKATFTRRKFPKDDMDKYLDDQMRDIKEIKSLLTDHVSTEFVPITIPESMGVEETKLLIEIINENRISVKNIVLNMVNQNDGCDFCASRKKDQAKYIEQVNNFFSDYNVIQIPLFPMDVRGLNSLTEVAEILSGNSYEYQPKKVKLKKINSRKLLKNNQKMEHLTGMHKLLLFGGKGGLGKTTVSAATALHLAKTFPDKKILIFSTDPAQALGRSFGLPITTEPIQIKNNLYAVALDAEAALEEFKKEYADEIDEAFSGFMSGGGVQAEMPFDKKIFDTMMEISPPGLDELMALSKITDFIDEKKYDIFILDTAPSGHLLHLLELPELMMDWYGDIIAILRKYRKVLTLLKTMRLMLVKKKSMKDIMALLKDETRTEFIVVTIPEEMGISETNRMLKRLREIEVSTHTIMINRVTPPTKCSFCASRREREQKYVKEIHEKFPDYAISEIPLLPYEVRGMDGLISFAEVMYGGDM